MYFRDRTDELYSDKLPEKVKRRFISGKEFNQQKENTKETIEKKTKDFYI